MLINTVILFLRDALPVFVLIAIVLSFWHQTARAIAIGCVLGVIVTVLIVMQRNTISEYFEGAGYELLKCLTLFVAFILSACILGTRRAFQQPIPHGLVIWLITFTVIPHSVDFSVFLVGFWSQKDAITPMLLGTFLGGGICASVAILLNLLLGSVKQRLLPLLVFALFATGQVSSCVLLLQQIDWLGDPGAVWNFPFISDESEYGHLLKALMGYEAAPSIIYLSVYAFSLLLLIGITLYVRQRDLSQLIKPECSS